MPANAGIHSAGSKMDSRFRGNDKEMPVTVRINENGDPKIAVFLLQIESPD
jgi:hypothetical protein